MCVQNNKIKMSRAPRTTTTRQKVEGRPPKTAVDVPKVTEGVAKTDPELASEIIDPNTKICYKRGKFLGKVGL